VFERFTSFVLHLLISINLTSHCDAGNNMSLAGFIALIGAFTDSWLRQSLKELTISRTFVIH
jgi:hypothetical protein